MSELKNCPICGAELKVHGPENWTPTFCDPDSGGDPYEAHCDCGFRFSTGTFDYAEFVAALNRRAQPENEPIVHCAECEHYTPSPMGGKGCLIHFNGRTEIIPRNPTDYCSYGKRKPERSEGE